MLANRSDVTGAREVPSTSQAQTHVSSPDQPKQVSLPADQAPDSKNPLSSSLLGKLSPGYVQNGPPTYASPNNNVINLIKEINEGT